MKLTCSESEFQRITITTLSEDKPGTCSQSTNEAEDDFISFVTLLASE